MKYHQFLAASLVAAALVHTPAQAERSGSSA